MSDQEDSPRPRKRRRSFYILGPLVVWFLLEVSAGLALWVLPDEEQPDLPEDDPDWLISAKDAWKHRFFQVDKHTIWRPSPGYREPPTKWLRYGTEDLAIDMHGHRVRPDSPEKSVAKPEGVRRILLVGGSHPFGMWVNADQSYIEVLGDLLNQREGPRWEVMNAASPGHTTFQGRKYIEEYGLVLEPDIVLFDLGMNDTLPLSVRYASPDHEVQAIPDWVDSVAGLLGSLPTYRLLRHALGGIVGRPEPSQIRVPMEQQLANQEAVRKLGSKKGFQTLYFSQVSVAPIGPGGRASCKYTPTGFEPYADVCAAFKDLGENAGLYFHDPIHSNAEGHAVIARTVLAKLDEIGWVKP